MGFKRNYFTLKDKPRSGCSKGLNPEELLPVINEEPSKTSRELGMEFKVSHMRLGKVSKAEKWVPHNLTENIKEKGQNFHFNLIQ